MATYVIFNCSESLKELLLAVNSYTTALSRLTFPLAFHALLLEDAIIKVKILSEINYSDVTENVRIAIVLKSNCRNDIHRFIPGKSLYH